MKYGPIKMIKKINVSKINAKSANLSFLKTPVQ